MSLFAQGIPCLKEISLKKSTGLLDTFIDLSSMRECMTSLNRFEINLSAQDYGRAPATP